MKTFLISVCDGTEMVKAMRLRFSRASEAETFLTENLTKYGERLFWIAGEQEMTIGEMIEVVREEKITGYMIDDGCVHRCRTVDNGFILWEEV